MCLRSHSWSVSSRLHGACRVQTSDGAVFSCVSFVIDESPTLFILFAQLLLHHLPEATTVPVILSADWGIFWGYVVTV